VQALELFRRRFLLDVHDAAALLEAHGAHRVEHAAVVAAVGARLHEHEALEAQLARMLEIVLERRARRAVTQIARVGIALLGPEDVEVAVAAQTTVLAFRLHSI
jgi:hypothetical protein